MATLIEGQKHKAATLGLYVQRDGWLADAFLVEVEIWDLSSGAPGEQVLPSGGGRVNVTTGAGHVSTGFYAVIDPDTGDRWIPAETMTRGVAIWTYTLDDGGEEVTVRRVFEVLAAATGATERVNLALVQDVREAPGIPAMPASVTNGEIWAKLVELTELVERVARQRFRPTAETKRISGSGSELLLLPEAFVGLSAVYRNGSEEAETGTELRAEGATGEDRRNPLVEVPLRSDGDLFRFRSPDGARDVFNARVPQVVVGIWGYVEPETLAAPLMIRNVVVREARGAVFAVRGISALGGGGGAGAVKRERTDGHEIEYAVESRTSGTRSGLLALFSDPASRDTVLLFRAPRAIAAAAPDPRFW